MSDARRSAWEEWASALPAERSGPADWRAQAGFDAGYDAARAEQQERIEALEGVLRGLAAEVIETLDPNNVMALLADDDPGQYLSLVRAARALLAESADEGSDLQPAAGECEDG